MRIKPMNVCLLMRILLNKTTNGSTVATCISKQTNIWLCMRIKKKRNNVQLFYAHREQHGCMVVLFYAHQNQNKHTTTGSMAFMRIKHKPNKQNVSMVRMRIS